MKFNLENELKYLNALNCIPLFGPRRIGNLIDYYGSAEAAWKANVEEYIKVLKIKNHLEQLCSEKDKVDPCKEWTRMSEEGVSCTSPAMDNYPALLKEIPFPPPILYFKGDLAGLQQPSVAIVGSRRCTYYGREVAVKLSNDLARSGFTIVSGMALGVDTAAHRGALDAGGYTAAVLGCGLDFCYPPGNKSLFSEITGNGVLISEFSMGTKPLPGNFPQRNRVISGLSLGTVVIEATEKSGALITANYALEHNREVFAVPGNVGSPYSKGCHNLLREGAKLVETVEDIMEELDIYAAPRDDTGEDNSSVDSLTEREQEVLNLIPYQPIHIDRVVNLLKYSPSEAVAVLLSLELKNKIRQTPGKYFCRV